MFKQSVNPMATTLFLALAIWWLPTMGMALYQQEPAPATEKSVKEPLGTREKVLVLPLSDDGRYMVDQVQAEFLIGQLERAEEDGYTKIILKIDTYGGVVFAARDITEQLLRTNLPTMAYVETKAISAGAFIAWACDEIAMERFTTIGDAQMIMQTTEGIKEAPEKAVTVFRSDWKKSSTVKGRSFALAQGFFDVKVEVLQVGTAEDFEFILREDYDLIPEAERKPILKVVCKKDQLLTMFAEEARDFGLVSVHESFESFLETKGITPVQLSEVGMTTNQEILRFIGASPWLFFLLTLIGLNGIYMELKAPGFGIPGLTAIVCFTIVFGSRYFLGTASPVEMSVFVLGLAFCAAEIFVLPGFGIAGVTGMVLMFGALVLASVPDFGGLPEVGTDDIIWTRIINLSLGLAATFVASIFTLIFVLPRAFKLPGARRGVSQKEFLVEDGYVMNTTEDEARLVGFEGMTLGDLRPVGKVKLDDGRYLDVTAGSNFIEGNRRVQISEVDGNRILVRAIHNEAQS